MIVAESMKLPSWTWQAVVDALMQEDLTRELSGVIAPTLLICGDEDALFSVDYQHRLLAALPTVSLEVLPGLGHSPHWEDPRGRGETDRRVRPLCQPKTARTPGVKQ